MFNEYVFRRRCIWQTDGQCCKRQLQAEPEQDHASPAKDALDQDHASPAQVLGLRVQLPRPCQLAAEQQQREGSGGGGRQAACRCPSGSTRLVGHQTGTLLVVICTWI